MVLSDVFWLQNAHKIHLKRVGELLVVSRRKQAVQGMERRLRRPEAK